MKHDLLKLADDVDAFVAKVTGIMGKDETELSPNAAALSIALLAALKIDTLGEVSAALRALANGDSDA